MPDDNLQKNDEQSDVVYDRCAKCGHESTEHKTNGWWNSDDYHEIDDTDPHRLQLCVGLVIVSPYHESYICQCKSFEPDRFDTAGCALTGYEIDYGSRSRRAYSVFKRTPVEHSEYWHEQKNVPIPADEAVKKKGEYQWPKVEFKPCSRCGDPAPTTWWTTYRLDENSWVGLLEMRYMVGGIWNVGQFCPKCIAYIVQEGKPGSHMQHMTVTEVVGETERGTLVKVKEADPSWPEHTEHRKSDL